MRLIAESGAVVTMGNMQKCFSNPRNRNTVLIMDNKDRKGQLQQLPEKAPPRKIKPAKPKTNDFTATDVANGNDHQFIMNQQNNQRSREYAAHQLQTSNQSSRSAVSSSKSSSSLLSSSHSTQQRLHLSSSSSTTTSSSSTNASSTTIAAADRKVSSLTDGLNELKSNMHEMKNIPNVNATIAKLRNSVENLMDDDLLDGNDTGGGGYADPVPVVTFPDDTPCASVIASPTEQRDIDSLKFADKGRNFTSSLMRKDGMTAEKQQSNFYSQKSLVTDDLSYEENSAANASLARIEVGGLTAEKSMVKQSEARSLTTSEMSHKASSNIAQSSMRVMTTDSYASTTEAKKQTTQTQKISSSSSYMSTGTLHTSSTTSCSSNQIEVQTEMTEFEKQICAMELDDLRRLTGESGSAEIEVAIKKYSACIEDCMRYLRDNLTTLYGDKLLNQVYKVMMAAWSVPKHGHELGYSLCIALNRSGGLDYLMDNCRLLNRDNLRFASAKLLEQCLTTENRDYVVKHGLDKVVEFACNKKNNTPEGSKVATGILEHLFKHSEETCSQVVQLGGLDAILFECRKNDVDTLRHCATALANLSLYGGVENQEAMINRKVPMWLFPLAFHNDDLVKYYACLAITVLVANAEFESQVLQSGTLGLVEPFVTSHNPPDFAKSNLAHAHGQSKTWLQHLVPILDSKREEARNLAAFHFCMEAGIKKQQGNTEIFNQIGAVDILKKVASCPNAVASKYAAQALRLIGEKLPHKLSQQVPLWSVEDVIEWVKQIGFGDWAKQFMASKVDGDLLLQLTEANLRDDIQLTNGIARARFNRELQKLKRMADYSSRDTTNINNFLQSLGSEYSSYTYSMLNAGVDNDVLRRISEDQLLNECGITNSIHRFRIMESIRSMEDRTSLNAEMLNKSLDVFISYRRSNGSQLASLLKVHLELRGFSVFIDVERLEAGKFDNNLLQSIQKAKHFILVLTENALDRCIEDADSKDWVHREIVAALNADCNIIPITISEFKWPIAEKLPEDMRQVCHFNGVMWIHDYQDACVEKLERFLRGEMSSRPDMVSRMTPGTPGTAGIGRMVQPPIYNRTQSNDSGKGGTGSTGSDRDVNGNSGGD